MIPYDRIILEMERQLSIAKRAGEERTMREALSAVRSLCEVALGDEVKQEKKIVPKMLSTGNEVKPLTSFEGTLLEEEDANGGSIFDF
ncbi:YwdI family protein [Filibacter tadaridae]|uniref:YwdI family protein n=1 Tax=Filibacter tadaridae TaxID=2483811 RepID=A0A3P5WI61_9BACL|nr:YwdI family protein [Filibacter tadaridae]VDC19360.1 hypothetical protein FILTAD_00297 [Filibacter tadaridae]